MDSGMPVPVSVSCGSHWACVAGLSSVLRVRQGLQQEVGCEGDDLVLLARTTDKEDENSCCLFVKCDPRSGEEIISLMLESQARTIEVYAGEEYLGTSRGDVVCTLPNSSSDEVVTLYKTFLKLDSSQAACKLKLLSLGGRLQVLIKGISVGVTAAHPRRLQSFPPAEIDLDCVRSMVEGSQLSSGAQQLMTMVQSQQRNQVPFGEQLLRFLRKPDVPVAVQRQVDGLQIPSDCGSDQEAIACKSGFTGSQSYQDSGTGSSTSDSGTKTTLNHRHCLPLRDDLNIMVSSFLQKSVGKDSNISRHSLLPFLHSLCGEVNHMRIGEPGQQSQRNQSEESAQRDYSGTCSFLEELIAKQMGAMEKRLLDHIDKRINRLQELMDARMGLLVNLLQSSHIASGERVTNGDVHIFNDL